MKLFLCPEALLLRGPGRDFGSSGQPVASWCASVGGQTWRGRGCQCSHRCEATGNRLCEVLPSKCCTGWRLPAELLSSASLFPCQSCGSRGAAVGPDCSEAALILGINWNFFFFAVFFGFPRPCRQHAAACWSPPQHGIINMEIALAAFHLLSPF